MLLSYKLLVLCTFIGVAAAFIPGAAPPLRLHTSVRTSATPTKMNLSLNSVAAASNALLLAFDPDGSKTDRLYNGVPITGNVDAPPWALPVLALAVGLGMALLIPAVLKPGTDAFNEGRSNAGIYNEDAGGKKPSSPPAKKPPGRK